MVGACIFPGQGAAAKKREALVHVLLEPVIWSPAAELTSTSAISSNGASLAGTSANPFSADVVEHFFKLFFGGVFLEPELVTSSRFFEFLFRMFSTGNTAVPAAGMRQIPLQLAAKLQAGTLVTGARVGKVTRSVRAFEVEIERGGRLSSLEVYSCAGADKPFGLQKLEDLCTFEDASKRQASRAN